MSLLLLSGGSFPPTNPILNEALVIKGPYPFGPDPGAVDNRLFLDELEQFSESDQSRILDQYQRDGYTSITLGPAVARGYDGQYPPTDWTRYPERVIRTMQECRRRGLRITMVVLPDCYPFLNGNTWDWVTVEKVLTPIYRLPQFQQCVENVQVEWEVDCSNDEACRATAYARRVFPLVQDIYWHTAPGHSAPGQSWEPIDEATMWRNFVKVGGTGWAVQDDAIWHSEWNWTQKWEAFKVNTADALRHCNGYNNWPLLKCWNREYLAYAVYHDNAPVSGLPVDWGKTSRELGVINTGDGGPIR